MFGLDFGPLRSIPKMVFLIAILSLVVHLVMTALFSHTYDSEYWLIIMQNIETGNGLYGLNGFYYTPVWGYMLSFADMLTQVFGAIPVLGDRFTDLIVTSTSFSSCHSPCAMCSWGISCTS